MQRHAVLLGALVALTALPGCIVYAKSVKREVVVGIETSEPVDSGRFLGWEITTRIEDDMTSVVVTAARLRGCTRTRTEVYDELETETTDVWPHELKPRDVWDVLAYPSVEVLFFPITVLTAVAAEIKIAVHHDTTTRRSRVIDSVRSTCAHVAEDEVVELTLPSGAVLTDATDEDGRASFAIPETEPDAGTAIVRISGQAREAAFFRTAAACARVREDSFARVLGAAAVAQRDRLLRAMPVACGDPHDRAWTLTATAARDAIGGRCEAIRSAAREVWSSDRELYSSVLLAEPDIAECFDGRAAARRRRAECFERRRAGLLQAQQVTDLDERTRDLLALPVCAAPGADPSGP